MPDPARSSDARAWLPGMVAHWATATPDATAIQCGGRTLSYRELDEAALNVACRIHDQGAAPGCLIAVPAERVLETVCVILGILRAGCAYLPLDTASPPSRTEGILAKAAPDTILGDALDLQPFGKAPARGAYGASSGGSDLAYVMPTSGTGGTVKLVEVTHSGICHSLRSLRSALGGITPQDRYLHVASFAFSSSVRQLFLPLSSGSRVVIATGDQRLDPHQMIRLSRESRITVLDIIPSVLSVLIDAIDTSGYHPASVGQDLRLLLLASEPLPTALVRRWRTASRRPEVAIYNMYGQTETAGIVSIQRVDTLPAEGTVPIGHALPGTKLSLLDTARAPVKDGAVGEIAVTGPGLARGYRADIELTREKFPPRMAAQASTRRPYLTGDLARRNSSGAIELAGRADMLVKVRGRHVDLTQVEQALQKHGAVAEAAAVISDGPDGTPRLRAYVRLAAGYMDRRLERRLRVLPNGLRIAELNPAETDQMYEEIFTRQVYLQHGITVPDDALVIDAGANIGMFSLSIATRHPGARVMAFEPAAPTARILKTNLRVNGYPNVTVRVQGLSDHAGTATLTWYPRASGLSSFHPSHADEHATLMSIIAYRAAQGTIPSGHELRGQAADIADAKLAAEPLRCTVVRLSDVLDIEGIEAVDLLKIDVQKSELEVLAGIADRHWGKISQIVAEVHDISGRLERISSQLAERGYTVATHQDPMLAGTGLHYLYARLGGARRPGTRPAAGGAREATRLRSVSDQQLTAFAAGRLDAYHVPESVEILDEFPRTVAGKTDRALLANREPGPAGPPADSGSAHDPLASEVAGIWREILAKPVSAQDDFFELGGSSLSAARVTARIRQRLGAPDVSIRLIFDEPRLDQFTAALRKQLGTGDD